MAWNKNGSLSKEQKEEVMLAQQKERESQRRLEANLPDFKTDYASLVKEHKIRHMANLAFVEGTPDWLGRMVLGVVRPVLQLQECADLVQKSSDLALQGAMDKKVYEPND